MINKETILKEKPTMADYAKNRIFISGEELEEYRKGIQIAVLTNEGKITDVSYNFIERILGNSEYFNAVQEIFQEKECTVINASVYSSGDIYGTYDVNMATLVAALNEYQQNNDLTDEEKQRVSTLTSYTSIDALKEDYNDITLKYNIDGREVEFPAKGLLAIILTSNEMYARLCSKDCTRVFGMPKEEVFYALNEFINKNEILKRYQTTNSIYQRVEEISSYKHVDMEAINKMKIDDEDEHYEVSINDELKKEILNGLPKDENDLAKASYIYIKMCRLLTYDPEFFAANQKGPSAKRHEDITNVGKITPASNEVVCYDFNSIYGTFLQELGIPISVDKGVHGIYGGSHASLSFRYDKFLINADSVVSILNGDLLNAKLNEKLTGLKCTNSNDNTRLEFDKIVAKMQKLIYEQDMKETKDTLPSSSKSFDKAIDDYRNIKMLEDPILSLTDKTTMLIDKIATSSLSTMDVIGYALKLKKIIFTENELFENFDMTIINEKTDESSPYMPIIILTIGEENIRREDADNTYFAYNPSATVTSTSKSEIESGFNSGKYAYIESFEQQIPGINIGGDNNASKSQK